MTKGTFNLQSATEADKIAGGAHILEGHPVAISRLERFVNKLECQDEVNLFVTTDFNAMPTLLTLRMAFEEGPRAVHIPLNPIDCIARVQSAADGRNGHTCRL